MEMLVRGIVKLKLNISPPLEHYVEIRWHINYDTIFLEIQFLDLVSY